MDKINKGKLIDIGAKNITDIVHKVDEYINEWKDNTDAILYIKKLSYDELKKIITEELVTENIYSLNELHVFWLNNFKEKFKWNIFIKYFLSRVIKKRISYIITSDMIILWEKIWLKLLSDEEIINELKIKLKEKWIIYLDDLNKISVKEFSNIIWNNLLLIYYFNKKWIFKSFIKKSDIDNFWGEIWLKERVIDKKMDIKNFLITNKILDYSDLISSWVRDIRDLLWWNIACREVLEWFWLKYIQDFRKIYIRKFARYVGLKWVPDEYNWEKSKELIINILKNNWIECIYSLKLNWLKWFIRIFRKKTILNYSHEKINNFLKEYIDRTIRTLKYEDLNTIWKLLWFSVLSEEEHKEKLIIFLDWKVLNKTRVKELYWKNPHIRYFINKIFWINDVKLLRVEHIDELKKYLGII